MRDDFPNRICGTWRQGLTLVELLVVLALAAAIMGLSVSTFSGLSHANLRADAMRISGALRMVYARSAINGLRYQVTIDLDENTFSVECSEENILVVAEDSGSRKNSRDPESDPFGLGGFRPTQEDCSEPLLEEINLRAGVRFVRILTAHNTEPVEKGVETIAYFPNGFVERSVIWLEEGENNMLALSIDPVSGRVRIHAGDYDVPRDFFEVEEDR